jgi:hypothetical protein
VGTVVVGWACVSRPEHVLQCPRPCSHVPVAESVPARRRSAVPLSAVGRRPVCLPERGMW